MLTLTAKPNRPGVAADGPIGLDKATLASRLRDDAEIAERIDLRLDGQSVGEYLKLIAALLERNHNRNLTGRRT